MKKMLALIKNQIGEAVSILTSRKKLAQTLRVPLYSNSIFLIINAGVSYAESFVFWILAARFYTAEQVGIGSALFSSVGLISQFASLGLNYSVIKFLAQPDENQNDLLNSSYVLSALAAIGVGLIYFLAADIWSPASNYLHHNPGLLAVVLVFGASVTVSNVSTAIFVAKRRAGFSIGLTMIANVVSLSLIIPLSKINYNYGIIVALGLPFLLNVIISMYFILPKFQEGFHPHLVIKKQTVKSIFTYSVWNYVSNLLWSGTALVIPLLVIVMLGAEKNAYFYIVWTIGIALLSIPYGISMSLFAEGSSDQAKLKNHIARSLKISLLLLIPEVIVMLIIGVYILRAFGQAYADNGLGLLRLMIYASVPATIVMIYMSEKRVKKEFKGLVIMPAFILIVTVLFSYFLLPRLGIPGPGIAWLTAQTCAAVFVVTGWLRNKGIAAAPPLK